jgi:hypothetical protein
MLCLLKSSEFENLQNIILLLWRTAPVDQGHLIIEDSSSHSDTPHSVGHHWTSDEPDVEPST